MGWIAEFVDELSAFDRRMNSAVIDSSILRHVPANVLAKQGLERIHWLSCQQTCCNKHYYSFYLFYLLGMRL